MNSAMKSTVTIWCRIKDGGLREYAVSLWCAEVVFDVLFCQPVFAWQYKTVSVAPLTVPGYCKHW